MLLYDLNIMCDFLFENPKLKDVLMGYSHFLPSLTYNTPATCIRYFSYLILSFLLLKVMVLLLIDSFLVKIKKGKLCWLLSSWGDVPISIEHVILVPLY